MVQNLSKDIITSSMSDPGFGLYTNNNYIPGIGPFNAVQVQRPDGLNLNNQTYIPGIETYPVPGNGVVRAPFSGNVTYPGSFTFAVPTQASSLMSTFTQTTQYREMSRCSSGVIGAPGIGTSWQHCIPQRMPWQDAMSGQTSNGISTFTGLIPSVSHYEGYSDYLKGSSSSRRLKRQALDSIKEESPENKVYITEEKMARRMRELSLNCQSSSPPSRRQLSSTSTSSSSPSSISSSAQCPSTLLSKRPSPFERSTSNQDICQTFSRSNDGRKRLKEIEDRLEVDSSDDENQRDLDLNVETEPRLHFTDIANSLLNPDPLLPKQILQDLRNKPCMQVVLWKPPGEDIKKVISSSNNSDTDNNQYSFKNNYQQCETSTISSVPLSSMEQEISTSGDMEMYDDDMDL